MRLIFLALCFQVFAVHAMDTVKIATVPYPPYHYEKDGLLNRFYTELFKSVGLKVEFVLAPIKRVEATFLKREVDIFTSYVLIEPKHFDLMTRVHMFNFAVALFYLDKPGVEFSKLDEVKGKRIGVILNTPYAELYKRHAIKTASSKDPSVLLEMALFERVALFESTLLTGLTNIHKSSELSKFRHFVFDILESGPAVLKSHPEHDFLVKKLRKGYANIKKNGQYIKILEAYWGKDNIPREVLPDDLKPFGTTNYDPMKVKSPQ